MQGVKLDQPSNLTMPVQAKCGDNFSSQQRNRPENPPPPPSTLPSLGSCGQYPSINHQPTHRRRQQALLGSGYCFRCMVSAFFPHHPTTTLPPSTGVIQTVGLPTCGRLFLKPSSRCGISMEYLGLSQESQISSNLIDHTLRSQYAEYSCSPCRYLGPSCVMDNPRT